MSRAIIVVIAIGAGIGLLAPAPNSSPKPVDTAAATADTAAPAPGWRPAVETRLERAASGHFHATAAVNGENVDFVVDTGASTVALTIADAQRVGIAVDPGRFEVVAMGASGPVRGEEIRLDRVDLDGKEVRNLRGLVLEGLGVSLLGQNYLSQITGVTITGDEMILR